ncbi:MAG: hypothetical protein OR995_02265 [Candidatus Nanopelagicales bacterium]|jgi:hypothetical protein|nr:hypothetical protein [Candidatus Nanopelagicales bacterium]
MSEAAGETPTHLNNHHLDTLSVIYSHPVSHNIRWVDVLHLLEAAGQVEEKHDGKFTVTLGEETEVFERPHHKDIDTQMVVDLRRMLKNAGFRPRAKGQEI